MIGKKTTLEFYAEDPLQPGFNNITHEVAYLIKPIKPIRHVYEYSRIHYFEKTRQTQSMVAYMIFTEYFEKFQWKIALWECY